MSELIDLGDRVRRFKSHLPDDDTGIFAEGR
jgi:hypothetical protein